MMIVVETVEDRPGLNESLVVSIWFNKHCCFAVLWHSLEHQKWLTTKDRQRSTIGALTLAIEIQNGLVSLDISIQKAVLFTLLSFFCPPPTRTHPNSSGFNSFFHSGPSLNLVMSSEDSHKFENRSDRDDWHNSHGSSRSREERHVTRQEYPQTVRGTDGRRYTQYDYNSDRSTRYAESNVSETWVIFLEKRKKKLN